MSGLGRTLAVGVGGVDGFVVEVEAHVSQGLPAFAVTGLGDSAIGQAPHRIRAACANIDQPLHTRKVVVNLSPASRRKTGSGFDLAIAVAALVGVEVIPARVVTDVAHLGELGLDGSVRPVSGVLPGLLAARRAGVRHAVVPVANATEASLVDGLQVHPVAHLGELVHRYTVLSRGGCPEPVPWDETAAEPEPAMPDLADVVGQAEACYALEVAAAGGHHLFMVGPPGAGKTMLAERLPGLLPPLTDEQALDVAAIRSVVTPSGYAGGMDRRAPFVAPHHGASHPALVGGGSSHIRPGAITLAHHGVLFLDEAPEFKPAVLQSLRQPIESGGIVVARANESVRFPARFQLVMAANPCPCGLNYGKGLRCTCTPLQQRSYIGRLSGPLLDRIDVHCRVGPTTRASLLAPSAEASAVVASRVAQARNRQARRWQGMPWTLNAHVPGSVLRSSQWAPPREAMSLLHKEVDAGVISMRGMDRSLRLAWTIADLREADRPTAGEVAQALALRQSTGAVA